MRLLAFLALLIAYPFVVYPFVLWLVARSRRPYSAPVPAHGHFEPNVSFIVVVHNAEAIIEEKIQNTLALDYPRNKIEFIFVSDASTDATDSLIQRHKEIRHLRVQSRSGKEIALKRGIDEGNHGILCCSDVSAVLKVDGVRRIVRHFADSTVGAVGSYDETTNSRFWLEAVHVRTGLFFRSLESRICSTVGVSGCFFAALRGVCDQIDPKVPPSDLIVSFICVRAGLRALLDCDVKVRYEKTATTRSEFARKVRTCVHGMIAVLHYRDLMNPFAHGWFAWQVINHKIMRWLSSLAVAAVACTVSSWFFLSPHGLPVAIWTLAAALALAALLVANKPVRARVSTAAAMTVSYGATVLVALILISLGKRYGVWKPTDRSHGERWSACCPEGQSWRKVTIGSDRGSDKPFAK